MGLRRHAPTCRAADAHLLCGCFLIQVSTCCRIASSISRSSCPWPPEVYTTCITASARIGWVIQSVTDLASPSVLTCWSQKAPHPHLVWAQAQNHGVKLCCLPSGIVAPRQQNEVLAGAQHGHAAHWYGVHPGPPAATEPNRPSLSEV